MATGFLRRVGEGLLLRPYSAADQSAVDEELPEPVLPVSASYQIHCHLRCWSSSPSLLTQGARCRALYITRPGHPRPPQS